MSVDLQKNPPGSTASIATWVNQRAGFGSLDVGSMPADLRAKLSVAFALLLFAGCGHQPRTIESSGGIKRTPASEHMISIVDLPLSEYSELQKFRGLEHLQVGGERLPVTDEHIQAIARLDFPRLREVSLALCPEVTDAGIQSLTNLSSIEGLLLRGTALTDRGMSILATGFPNLKGINVDKCLLLTKAGFLELVNSPTITSVGMSVDTIPQRQIEEIIDLVPNVTWWIFSDPRDQLDQQRLRQLGISKGITIQVVDENNVVRGLTSVDG